MKRCKMCGKVIWFYEKFGYCTNLKSKNMGFIHEDCGRKSKIKGEGK